MYRRNCPASDVGVVCSDRSENGKLLKLLKKAKSDDFPETSAREDTCEDDSAEDENEDPLASQKRAAPRLLNELGRLLYRNRGASLQLGDILNYSADAALKQPKEAKDEARRKAARRKKSQKKPSKTNQDATGQLTVSGLRETPFWAIANFRN